jgi:hypothetical protein
VLSSFQYDSSTPITAPLNFGQDMPPSWIDAPALENAAGPPADAEEPADMEMEYNFSQHLLPPLTLTSDADSIFANFPFNVKIPHVPSYIQDTGSPVVMPVAPSLDSSQDTPTSWADAPASENAADPHAEAEELADIEMEYKFSQHLPPPVMLNVDNKSPIADSPFPVLPPSPGDIRISHALPDIQDISSLILLAPPLNLSTGTPTSLVNAPDLENAVVLSTEAEELVHVEMGYKFSKYLPLPLELSEDVDSSTPSSLPPSFSQSPIPHVLSFIPGSSSIPRTLQLNVTTETLLLARDPLSGEVDPGTFFTSSHALPAPIIFKETQAVLSISHLQSTYHTHEGQSFIPEPRFLVQLVPPPGPEAKRSPLMEAAALEYKAFPVSAEQSHTSDHSIALLFTLPIPAPLTFSQDITLGAEEHSLHHDASFLAPPSLYHPQLENPPENVPVVKGEEVDYLSVPLAAPLSFTNDSNVARDGADVLTSKDEVEGQAEDQDTNMEYPFVFEQIPVPFAFSSSVDPADGSSSETTNQTGLHSGQPISSRSLPTLHTTGTDEHLNQETEGLTPPAETYGIDEAALRDIMCSTESLIELCSPLIFNESVRPSPTTHIYNIPLVRQESPIPAVKLPRPRYRKIIMQRASYDSKDGSDEMVPSTDEDEEMDEDEEDEEMDEESDEDEDGIIFHRVGHSVVVEERVSPLVDPPPSEDEGETKSASDHPSQFHDDQRPEGSQADSRFDNDPMFDDPLLVCLNDICHRHLCLSSILGILLS